jgi:hypothetical protein
MKQNTSSVGIIETDCPSLIGPGKSDTEKSPVETHKRRRNDRPQSIQVSEDDPGSCPIGVVDSHSPPIIASRKTNGIQFPIWTDIRRIEDPPGIAPELEKHPSLVGHIRADSPSDPIR